MGKPKRFELWNWAENNGDGSVHIHHTVTEEAATKKDEGQVEDGQGWGESSVSQTLLEVEDGKLYLIGSRWDSKTKENVEYRVELKQVAR